MYFERCGGAHGEDFGVVLHLLRHMHICTRSIQIYFCIFFHFICVLLFFHCSHIIPIFSEIFPIFLPILFTSKACHFDMALLILLPFKRLGWHSHRHLGQHYYIIKTRALSGIKTMTGYDFISWNWVYVGWDIHLHSPPQCSDNHWGVSISQII